jgi:hypothetical protein
MRFVNIKYKTGLFLLQLGSNEEECEKCFELRTMISEVAELKEQHENTCYGCCSENCEFCEDEGEIPQTCIKCPELRTMISELEELKKQHIENQKKKIILRTRVAIMVAEMKMQEKSEADIC